MIPAASPTPAIADDPNLRIVTMTVFDTDGQVAAKATVKAIYTWKNEVVLREETTDAAGQVRWKLPPVRVIVWGDRIPAGVITGDQREVTTPLPALVTNYDTRVVQFIFRRRDPGEQQAHFFACKGILAEGDGLSYWRSAVSSYGPQSASDVEHGESFSGYVTLTPAMSCSLVIGAMDTRPWLSMLGMVYGPFMDGCEKDKPIIWPVTLVPCPQVRVRFRLADGTSVPGVSRLRVIPAQSDCAVLPEYLHGNIPLFTPVEEHGDGSYTISVLRPGKYRLLVDLYDETMPAPESLTIQVDAGQHQQVVTLPAPLASLPPGCTVNWITPNAPSYARVLTMSSSASPMPVFGPVDGPQTWWCSPRPDVLEIHRPAAPVQRISRRKIILESPTNPITCFLTPFAADRTRYREYTS